MLTIESNDDVSPYSERQMAVLNRDQRMAWLDSAGSESELLKVMPTKSFRVDAWDADADRQPKLTL